MLTRPSLLSCVWSVVVPVAALVVGCSSPSESTEPDATPGAGGSTASPGGAATTGGAPVGTTAGSPTTPSGGASNGTSGSGPSAGAAGASAAGGVGGSGGSASGGASTGGAGPGDPPADFDKPVGKIPNSPLPADKADLPESKWKDGILSPSLLKGKSLTQPTVINGYLVIAGNENFWFYDVSDPAAPKELAHAETPGARGGEAESHTVSYARYGNNLYMVTLSGTGIDTWNVNDVKAPKHIGTLKISPTNYGDYTNAIWGVSWQGQYIYVGATNNGIKVVDATDPTQLKAAGAIATSDYGNVSAGPLDAIGNILVVTTPKENGGVATLDISNPTQPKRLASFTAPNSYIGMFHRRWVFLQGPVRAWDVLSNPSSIGTGSSPIGSLNTGGSEYVSFQDDIMYLGHVRAEISGKPGASKIDVSDPKKMSVTGRVWGRMDQNGKNDDQFTIGIGNVLVIADDQAPYHGWFTAVRQAAPDSIAPIVDTVSPKSGESVPVTSRIGITFSDNIELATVNPASFIVRPVGGQPLAGKFGLRMSVLNFDPDEDLKPGTTYEVVLPKGGVADLAGNGIAAEFKSTFTTK
jgi:Bacterial Ig-like domain/LVIVD repeat